VGQGGRESVRGVAGRVGGPVTPPVLWRLVVADCCCAARAPAPFPPPVQWGIEQFKEAKDDAHPDAIACRLRLTLVCVEAQCGEVAPSDDKDYAAYVAKVDNVSRECRLHLDEEITLATAFEVPCGGLL
jgi:hypothetical protein